MQAATFGSPCTEAVLRNWCQVLALLMTCLLAGPVSADPLPFPTAAELGRTIDQFNGPCGHADGDGVLSGTLLLLAPLGHHFTFTATIVECDSMQRRPLTEREALFEWLGVYDQRRDEAWTWLADALQSQPQQVGSTLRRGALILLLQESPERVAQMRPLLRQQADPATIRLALTMEGGQYLDPFARGLGRDLDATGTLYRAAFADLGILPLCDNCPSEPRGTDVEQAWAFMFLSLHPRQQPRELPARLAESWYRPYLQQYTDGSLLERSLAAVVLWRLHPTESR